MFYWKLTKAQFGQLSEDSKTKYAIVRNTIDEAGATQFIVVSDKHEDDPHAIGVIMSPEDAEETILGWGQDKAHEMGLV